MNTRDLGFINFNNEEMQFVKFNGTIVYEAWKNLMLSKIPPLTLPKCKGVPLIDYKIYGDSVQEGTPTPETPIEIESVGEKTKNLVNIKRLPVGVYYNNYNVYLTKPVIVSAGEVPTEIDGNHWRLRFTLQDGTYLYAQDNKIKEGGAIVNISEDNPAVKIQARGDQIKSGQYDKIQIEYGTVATDYEPYGYKIPAKARGKNLFKSTGNVVGTLVISDGSIYSSYKWGTTTDFIPLKAGAYIINYKSGINLRNIALFNENKEIVGNFWSERKNPYKFTLDKDYLVRIDFERAGNVDIENLETFFTEYQVQLEEGTKATEYEPYVEPVTTNIYLNEPLRKLGDYVDIIDFAKQKIYRKIGNIVLDDSLPYTFYTYNTDLDNTYHFYISVTGTREPQIIPNTKMFSNRFIAGNLSMTNNVNDSLITSRYGTRIYGQLQKALIDSYEGATEKGRFIAFLNEYYTEVTYVLETPIEETIELPNIPTHKGTTIIEVDTSILPSNMEVVYKGKEV